jgi:hypothetical protein
MIGEEEGREEGVSSLQDDPGSMAFKLAHAEEAPQSQDEIEAARQADEEDAANRQAEAERAEAAAVTETAEEKAVREAAETEAKLEPPKPPKYTSIEEAEKGAREAAAKMTAATEAAARDREAREAAEQELETLRAAEAERVAAEKAAKTQPEIEAKYAEAIKKIAAIPLGTNPETGEVVYPDDYDEQVARAWAGTALNPEDVIEEAAKRAEQRLEEKQAAERTRTAERTATDEAAATRADAEKLATGLGLDMTPGSADYRVFYTFVDELAGNPEHELRGKPFEQQVKWATDGVRQVLGKKIELTDAERAAARRYQERHAILERGVTRAVSDEKPRQRSMQEILEAQSHPVARS